MNKTNVPRLPLPHVTKHQAIVMASRLFNLNITDPSSVKALASFDDRNFYMQGSLNSKQEDIGTSDSKEYILKIASHAASNHDCLIETQHNAMLFLQARDYKCPTPVPSIFGTSFVMCKFPRSLPSDSAALEKGDVKGVGDLEDETAIYDGEEYSEKEFFVCAVRLLNFVPGKMMNEIPLSTQLLFDVGMAVGRLDRDLKEFGCSRLDRPGFLWDMSCVGDTVEQFLEAVSEIHYAEIARDVCESFRKEVSPKLHLLPKQFIHGDLKPHNILLIPVENNNVVQEIGFIDFGFLNYGCRIFDVAISLMQILNVAVDLDFSGGRTRMAGHFLAGYHSVNPLTNEEIELLPVLIASRYCQSLVYGAYTKKALNPGEECIMDLTARSNWKNFEAFWKLPREETLQMWKQMSNTDIVPSLLM